MKKAVIFDLDGTVSNTIDTIAYFANLALEHFGYPAIETETYKVIESNLIKEQILEGESANTEDFIIKNSDIFSEILPQIKREL